MGLLYHKQKIRQATAGRKARGKSFPPGKNPGGWKNNMATKISFALASVR
jgi:hypothetical protein